jgi:hypothetical protein
MLLRFDLFVTVNDPSRTIVPGMTTENFLGE